MSVNKGNNYPISHTAIEKLLENQSKELEVRTQELAIRKIELEYNQSYSLKALSAQKEDRKESRGTHLSIIKLKIIAYSVCFLLVLVFSGFAIYMKETKIVIQIMQIGLTSIGTGFGGYWFGKIRGYNLANDDKNN